MKKLIVVILTAVLLFSMATSAALADPKHVSADGLYAMVDDANAQINTLVNRAIATPEDDVKQLLHDIKKIVHSVESYAKKLHAEVKCEIKMVYIDSQWVAIDPLYVINIRQ